MVKKTMLYTYYKVCFTGWGNFDYSVYASDLAFSKKKH